jgi:hypothetical protein
MRNQRQVFYITRLVKMKMILHPFDLFLLRLLLLPSRCPCSRLQRCEGSRDAHQGTRNARVQGTEMPEFKAEMPKFAMPKMDMPVMDTSKFRGHQSSRHPSLTPPKLEALLDFLRKV